MDQSEFRPMAEVPLPVLASRGKSGLIAERRATMGKKIREPSVRENLFMYARPLFHVCQYDQYHETISRTEV